METYSLTNLPSQYISHLLLLKTNSLSDTTVSQSQTVFICSNLAVVTVEYSGKYFQS